MYMTGIDATDFFNKVAQVLNALWPAFAVICGVALGLGLMQYTIRMVRSTFDDKPIRSYEVRKPKLANEDLTEKRKNDEVLWPEKPKNDFIVGIGDDGELIYGDREGVDHLT